MPFPRPETRLGLAEKVLRDHRLRRAIDELADLIRRTFFAEFEGWE